MSTFLLPGNAQVSVSLPENLSRDQLLSFPAFKNWLRTLQANLSRQESDENHEFHSLPYHLKKIDVQAADWFADGKYLGFVKLRAKVENEGGESLPGNIFLRGAAVAMMVVLQPDDLSRDSEEEKYVLLTVQPRIPAGSLAFVELPAGMVDDDGSFAGAAAREIDEELGLTIPASELINLTELAIPVCGNDSLAEIVPRALFPSPGGSDEYISIFLHEKRIPRKTMGEWTGKLTGLRDHGEKITLKLVRLQDLWKDGSRDSKAMAAWGLYTGLKREGRL